VADAVHGVDFIFHQAAFVSVPKSMIDPNLCYDINVQGTANLLEAARQAGIAQVVLASSAAVYGDSQEFPLRETVELRALSPYAASKQVDEIYAGMYTRAFGLPVVALRYFNVYGPRQSPDSDYAAVIPIFIRRLVDGKAPTVYGDGQQKRDFIFVADLSQLARRRMSPGGGTINICTGTETVS
jgi:nucleoside-diphosphate-sugar epimerase